MLGEWWLATTNRRVTFESWCERDYLIEFDFDPEIVGVAAQPFAVWLTGRRWVAGSPTVGQHLPRPLRPKGRRVARSSAARGPT